MYGGEAESGNGECAGILGTVGGSGEWKPIAIPLYAYGVGNRCGILGFAICIFGVISACSSHPGVSSKSPLDDQNKTVNPHTASTIKQSVPRLNSLIDLISTSLVVYLPQPKPHLGHLIAIVELNARNRHDC